MRKNLNPKKDVNYVFDYFLRFRKIGLWWNNRCNEKRLEWPLKFRIILVKIVRTTGVSFTVQRDQLLLISTIRETQKSLRATTARGLIGDISAANASSPPTAPFSPHSSNSAYQNIRAKFSTKKTQKYTGNALEKNDQSGYLAVQPAKKGEFSYKFGRLFIPSA